MSESISTYPYIFGIDMGIFLAAFFLTLMFALSFFFQNGFNRFYLRIFSLAATSFLSLTIYNVYFQHAMYQEVPHFYPDILLTYGAYFGPVSLGTITYIFLALHMTSSVESLSFCCRRRKLINSLYCVDALTFTLLFFIHNQVHAILLIEGLFVLRVLFALYYFYSTYKKGTMRYIMIVAMSVVIISLIFLTSCYYWQIALPKYIFFIFNCSLALASLLLSFVAVRYGFDEVARFMTVSSSQRHLVTDIVRALDEKEFFLEYQPKRDLHTGNICSVEALIRWQHPKRGRLMPDEFILLTEKTDLIDLLCRWLVDSVVQQSKSLSDKGYDLPISLNFSVNNIMPTMAKYLVDALRQTGVSSDKVVVEITESVFFNDSAEKRLAISLLEDAAVMISIDDYGAGFSSLSNLDKINVGELKIDRSFVCDLAFNQQHQIIVTSIVTMCQGLGITVVAEGVEDDTTVNWLKSIGCDVIQGYYVSKPLAVEELTPWLSSHRTVRAA